MLPFNIGPGELILFLIIALVVLGPGKLPDVAQSLGKSVREFRKAATDISDAGKLDVPPPSAEATPPAPPLQTPVAPAATADAAPPAVAPPPPADPGAHKPEPEAETAAAGSPARDSNLA